jgi:hypothetical protein
MMTWTVVTEFVKRFAQKFAVTEVVKGHLRVVVVGWELGVRGRGREEKQKLEVQKLREG